MERETGIEPATNSLEGCDSTTELLPPSRTHCAPRYGGRARPSATSRLRFSHVTGGTPAVASQPWRSLLACQPKHAVAPVAPHPQRRAKAGGEGRIRTSEAAWATDLQSAAFDRFATSPSRTDTAPVAAAPPAADPDATGASAGVRNPGCCGGLSSSRLPCSGLNRPRHGASILGAGEGI